MQLYTFDLSTDIDLGVEIEERTELIRQVVDLRTVVSNTRTYDFFKELAQFLARDLATGEPAGIVFHRESAHARLIADITSLVTHFTSTFPYLIAVDGRWDRKAGKHLYSIVQVDHL